jgi:hypothetical protein
MIMVSTSVGSIVAVGGWGVAVAGKAVFVGEGAVSVGVAGTVLVRVGTSVEIST